MTVVDPGTVSPASLERLLARACGCRVLARRRRPGRGDPRPPRPLRRGRLGRSPLRRGDPGRPSRSGRAPGGGRCGEQRSAMMTAFGVPDSLLSGVAAAWRAADVVEWAAGVTIVPVDDGDVVHAGGRLFTAHVTPGHAPGHLSLWCDEAGFLVSGDHLLARIVPLPGLEPSSTGTGHRHSLDEYLSSLPRFVDLDPAVVLPGHGEAFTGVDVLARRLQAHHADRCATVRAIVAELGQPTPFDVAQRLLWHAGWQPPPAGRGRRSRSPRPTRARRRRRGRSRRDRAPLPRPRLTDSRPDCRTKPPGDLPGRGRVAHETRLRDMSRIRARTQTSMQ